MGCFLGCFGGEKDQKRRKQRINRGSPQRQRNGVQNVVQQENKGIAAQSVSVRNGVPNVVQQENIVIAEQSTKETITTNLVPEFRTKPEEVVEQQPSPSPSPIPSPSRSPKKKVSFNSNITTYEHLSVEDSIDNLPEPTTNTEKEKHRDSNKLAQSEDENSVSSSLASYPSNHRYHNARDSDDDEAEEEYGDDSDLDDLDDDYDDEDEDIGINAKISGHEVWAESVESPMIPDEPIKSIGSQNNNARDRSDYVNSVLNPVENISQWKAVKSKGTHVSKPQKENSTAANFESPRLSFSSEPIFKKKPDQSKNEKREIAVDTSLSNWLGQPEVMTPSKKTNFSGFETNNISGETTIMSEGRNSARSFEDRPILGALTVEELRQMSASNSPRKSPSRSPDDMPIIGSVGSYWNDNSSSKRHTDSVSSFKGIPNTTSKYREDKRVSWHSTPFETRLERALNRGAAEA